MKIDINTDLGEGYGRWSLGEDETLMRIVSSANVACGFHGGDAIIMTRMVQAAKDNNVALGAHVGLPDLLGFGRVVMDIKPSDFAKHALYQLGALAAIAKVGGYPVIHAGSHGALGEMTRNNPEFGTMMLDVFKAFDPTLIIAAEPNGITYSYARSIGLRVVGKIFADRAYTDEGHLLSRKLPGAVITDTAQVEERISQFMNDSTITAVSGKRIRMNARCVLIHSDTPGAVEIASTVRRVVESGGGQVAPLSELAE